MIGLVVNPVAGVGGPAGLAGSDGADVQRLALARGARSRAQERTAAALAVLAAQHPSLVVATAAGAMGGDAVRAAGLVPRVVYAASQTTDAADTSRAVAAVAAAGAELILVVGGDGTLRDAVAGLDAARPASGSSLSALSGSSLSALAGSSLSALSGSSLSALELHERMPDGGADAGESSAVSQTVMHSAPGSAGERMPGEERMPADGRMPAVLGVPAGVKMYSPVFAVSPRAAGAIAAEWVARGGLPVEEREVLDIDEAAMRRARVDPALYGFLRVPYRAGRTQARKAATPATEAAAVEAAARGVVARMLPGVRYLLGPGGTTAEIARQLGVEGAPLGVDVVLDGALLTTAASEQELLAEISRGPAKAVVTVIGGQGFLLGRGNQQLSASVLRALGDDPLLVVAPEQKLIDLHGHPLIVDTGDAELDAKLAGHVRIVTGIGTSSLYAVTAPELAPTQ